ncbi:MAG: C40 family peptidase [Muribaculaceae bacterium]|nr:C40 family peptidase [Muribaculaceae bacterium]
MISRQSNIILILTTLALLFSSCGTGKKGVSASHGGTEVVVKERNKPSRHNGDPGFDVSEHLADRIVAAARKWIGTPYRYGGKDRKGTDCSGMTMSLFDEVAGIALPRNSGAQYEYCVSIGHEDLQPGDLVFFSGKAGGGSVSHVGLYIGDRKMIHASSSRGVVESSIDERYWLTHYYGSGRVNGMTIAASGRKSSKKRRNDNKTSVRRPDPLEPARISPANTAVSEAVQDVESGSSAVSDVIAPESGNMEDTVVEDNPEESVLERTDDASVEKTISDEVKAAFSF